GAHRRRRCRRAGRRPGRGRDAERRRVRRRGRAIPSRAGGRVMTRLNRVVEQLATSRVRGAPAYVTAAIRVVTGAVFVSVSTGKFLDHMQEAIDFKSYGVPVPNAAVYVVGVVELVGGMLLVLGLFTRVAALFLACDMVGAISTAGVMEGGSF